MAWISRKTYEHLEEMLDAAIAEEFEESAYDESEMSRLETKWKRFLSASALSEDNVKKEHLAVQEMVSDISHQVKTPIANLRLYGEILQERLEGENKALAQRLMEQTELLDFLIQSLVKISRLESGTIQVLPKKQHLCPLLEAVIKRGEEKQKKRNIRLLKTGWDAELSARFDRKWTEEAVYNILDNALKYTKGSSTVKIHVKPYEFFVCVEIEDEGPGVILDEVPRLFDRFYRSPQMKDREGVGLGLFLSREILKKQKGYIKVKNGEKGACFQIYLPVSIHRAERRLGMGTILKTELLKKYYGTGENQVRALDGIDLSIEDGEFIAVVGTSGSGKSTLLHMLGGLDRPTSGKVYVDGKDIFSLKDDALCVFRRRKIGFVFQSYNLVPVLNVEENICLPIELDGGKADRSYIREIEEVLGIENKRKSLPGQLSGGQQQRVAIARALAAKPAIVLADEPTGNLDSRTSQDVLGLLKVTGNQFKQTIVMITHNEEIAQMADRIIRIEDGKILERR